MYARWPQNCPCLIPPATPKLALAPEGVPVIQPPPVTESAPAVQPGGAGAGWQVISACAEETITSATPGTMIWSALTVMSPAPLLVCSLIITSPTTKGTLWLGSPETVTVWPFTDSAVMSELPLAVAPPSLQTAAARACSKPAETVLPATVSESSATDASERLALPRPTVDACNTSAVSRPGTLAFRSDASSAPPDGGRGPASASTTGGRPSTVACNTVARPL